MIVDKLKDAQTKRVIIMAHAGFKHDFPLLQKALLSCQSIWKHKEDLKSAQNEIAVFFQHIETKCEFMFIDTVNLLWTSLEVITTMFQVEHAKGSVDFSKINPFNFPRQIVKQNMIEYLTGDCLGLCESFQAYRQKIFDKYSVDVFGKQPILTSSSLAMRVFKTNYYDQENTPIHIPTLEQNTFASKAYKGGSNMIFWRGRFLNRKIRSGDFNSSYPHEMYETEYPIGPYKMKECGFVYDGRELPCGVFEIIILESPDLPIFFLCDVVDGLLTAGKFQKYKLYVTTDEIKYAQTLGYSMFLVWCIYSEKTSKVFRKFVESVYNDRKTIKNELKELAKIMKTGELLAQQKIEYHEKDFLQENLKVILNSLYGKFGQKLTQDVETITDNEDFILDMALRGDLSIIEKMNDRYFRVVGRTQCHANSNFLIASMITAGARIKLHRKQMELHKLGFLVIYSDTDSIYFCDNENWSEEESIAKYEQAKKEVFDSTGALGGLKPEIEEKLGCESCDDAVFVALKMYSLRNSESGKEIVKCKGLAQWNLYGDNEKQQEKNKARREQYGIKSHIGHQDFIDLITINKPIVIADFERTSTQKKNLKADSNAAHMWEVKLVTQTIAGKITKAYLERSSEALIWRCIPQYIWTNVEFDLDNILRYVNHSFIVNTLDEACRHFAGDEVTRENLFQRFYIYQQESTRQYHLFSKIEDARKMISANGDFLEEFLDTCPVMFDVDVKKPTAFELENKEHKLARFLDVLACLFRCDASDFNVIDRSRVGKISYHIRLRDTIINKQEMWYWAQKLVFADTKMAKIKINPEKRKHVKLLQEVRDWVERYKRDFDLEDYDGGEIEVENGVTTVSIEVMKDKELERVWRHLHKITGCECGHIRNCNGRKYLSKEMSFRAGIDLNIYRDLSSLRFTDEQCRFEWTQPMLSLLTRESREKLVARKQFTTACQATDFDRKQLERAEEIMPILKGCKILKAYANGDSRELIVKTKHDDGSCSVCKRKHDKVDNRRKKKILITSKHVSLCCFQSQNRLKLF